MCFLWLRHRNYESLQIVVLLLQACLLGSLGLIRTLLLQQLHTCRPQQDCQFWLFVSLFACCLKTGSVASCLRERYRCFLNPVLKRRFSNLFVFQLLPFRIALLLLTLYKSYVSQSGVSICDPNGRKVELVFVKRHF